MTAAAEPARESDLALALAEDTLSLCRVPSETGDESAIAALLQARCAAVCAPGHVRRVGNTVWARGPLRPGRPLIALFGHSDTVRPATRQRLEIDRDAGRVYGCGASDMKGGLAVMLRLLAEADVLPGAGLLCVFYDKEEGPASESGLLPLLADGAPLLRGAEGPIDLAFCLEPTDNRIHAGCVGGLQARVEARGRRAHSARPWQGENAIYAALPLLTKLRDLPRREVVVQGLPFYEVMTATQAATVNSRNVVPDSLVINVNYRFAPGKSMETARAELRDFIGPGYGIEVVDEAPSGRVCLDQPLLRAWQAALGLEVEAKQAWTDVARLTDLGLAAVNFGPGDTAQAHQADESASMAALAQSYRALRQLLTLASEFQTEPPAPRSAP